MDVIYRHPKSKITIFIDSLDIKLSSTRKSKQLYIFGGMITNLFNSSDLPCKYDVIKYLMMSSSHSMLTTIDKLTRVMENTSLLIDHILINSHSYSIASGVITTDISRQIIFISF